MYTQWKHYRILVERSAANVVTMWCEICKSWSVASAICTHDIIKCANLKSSEQFCRTDIRVCIRTWINNFRLCKRYSNHTSSRFQWSYNDLIYLLPEANVLHSVCLFNLVVLSPLLYKITHSIKNKLKPVRQTYWRHTTMKFVVSLSVFIYSIIMPLIKHKLLFIYYMRNLLFV